MRRTEPRVHCLTAHRAQHRLFSRWDSDFQDDRQRVGSDSTRLRNDEGQYAHRLFETAHTQSMTYIFELDGVTSANAATVAAALNAIPGVQAALFTSAKGVYFVRIEADLTEDETLDLVIKAIGHLGITVKKVISISPANPSSGVGGGVTS
jgi:hypothetical protein